MESWLIALLVAGLYLLITLWAGWRSGRGVSASISGYVAGDRAMSTLLLYFVLGASVFSSFAFLGGPGWAYSRGMAAVYIVAYGTIGMVPLYFFGPRARRLGARFGFVTQAELLAHRFNSPALSVVLAVLSVIAFVPYLTLQMKGAGYIVATISEGRIPEWTGALVTYGVVMLYVIRSGVMGIGWTNTLQGAFMLVIAWGLGLYLPYTLYGGVGAMFEQIAASDQAALLTMPGLDGNGDPWTWWGYTSVILISATGFSVWPHYFMKSYAARSERSLRLTVVLYPTFQLFLVPILLIGFAGVLAFPGVEPADTILPFILTQLDLSPLLVGLVCAGTLAASMSSGDAILHAAASIGIRDGVRRVLRRPPSDATQRRWIQGLVVVISIVSYYFAVASEVSIVALLLGSYGGVAQIFPLIFVAFYWPRATGPGALAGLVGGLVVNTIFLIEPAWRPVPIHEGLYGLAANLFLLIAVSLATPPEAADRVQPYIDAGRPLQAQQAEA
ncbi:MAG: sodium:solute symporter family protein [Bacteroidota bacterium]